MTFYTLWTTAGLAKRANAEVMGTQIQITHAAVGDGNGSAVTPQTSQTELVNEVWRGAVNLIEIDSGNPNWVNIEAVIPASVGDWTIRELGLFDDDGDLVAVGNHAETYKPVLESGMGLDVYLKVTVAVENTDTIELLIDPAVALASRKYVDDKFTTHNTGDDSHEDLINDILSMSQHMSFFYATALNR